MPLSKPRGCPEMVNEGRDKGLASFSLSLFQAVDCRVPRAAHLRALRDAKKKGAEHALVLGDWLELAAPEPGGVPPAPPPAPAPWPEASPGRSDPPTPATQWDVDASLPLGRGSDLFS